MATGSSDPQFQQWSEWELWTAGEPGLYYRTHEQLTKTVELLRTGDYSHFFDKEPPGADEHPPDRELTPQQVQAAKHELRRRKIVRKCEYQAACQSRVIEDVEVYCPTCREGNPPHHWLEERREGDFVFLVCPGCRGPAKYHIPSGACFTVGLNSGCVPIVLLALSAAVWQLVPF